MYAVSNEFLKLIRPTCAENNKRDLRNILSTFCTGPEDPKLVYLNEISKLEELFTTIANIAVETATENNSKISDYDGIFNEKFLSSNVKYCWKYLISLSRLSHYHVTNASAYHQLCHDVQEISTLIHKQSEIISSQITSYQGCNLLNKTESITNVIKDHLKNVVRLRQRIKLLLERGRHIKQIRQRIEPITNRLLCHMLCDIVGNDLDSNVREGEEVLLIDNSDPNMWTVCTTNGKLIRIPSICVEISGPDLNAIDLIVRAKDLLIITWSETISSFQSILQEYVLQQLTDIKQNKVFKLKNADSFLKFETDFHELILDGSGGDVSTSYFNQVSALFSTIKTQSSSENSSDDILKETDVLFFHKPLKKLKEHIEEYNLITNEENSASDYQQLIEIIKIKKYQLEKCLTDLQEQNKQSELSQLTWKLELSYENYGKNNLFENDVQITQISSITDSYNDAQQLTVRSNASLSSSVQSQSFKVPIRDNSNFDWSTKRTYFCESNNSTGVNCHHQFNIRPSTEAEKSFKKCHLPSNVNDMESQTAFNERNKKFQVVSLKIDAECEQVIRTDSIAEQIPKYDTELIDCVCYQKAKKQKCKKFQVSPEMQSSDCQMNFEKKTTLVDNVCTSNIQPEVQNTKIQEDKSKLNSTELIPEFSHLKMTAEDLLLLNEDLIICECNISVGLHCKMSQTIVCQSCVGSQVSVNEGDSITQTVSSESLGLMDFESTMKPTKFQSPLSKHESDSTTATNELKQMSNEVKVKAPFKSKLKQPSKLSSIKYNSSTKTAQKSTSNPTTQSKEINHFRLQQNPQEEKGTQIAIETSGKMLQVKPETKEMSIICDIIQQECCCYKDTFQTDFSDDCKSEEFCVIKDSRNIDNKQISRIVFDQDFTNSNKQNDSQKSNNQTQLLAKDLQNDVPSSESQFERLHHAADNCKFEAEENKHGDRKNYHHFLEQPKQVSSDSVSNANIEIAEKSELITHRISKQSYFSKMEDETDLTFMEHKSLDKILCAYTENVGCQVNIETTNISCQVNENRFNNFVDTTTVHDEETGLAELQHNSSAIPNNPKMSFCINCQNALELNHLIDAENGFFCQVDLIKDDEDIELIDMHFQKQMNKLIAARKPTIEKSINEIEIPNNKTCTDKNILPTNGRFQNIIQNSKHTQVTPPMKDYDVFLEFCKMKDNETEIETAGMFPYFRTTECSNYFTVSRLDLFQQTELINYNNSRSTQTTEEISFIGNHPITQTTKQLSRIPQRTVDLKKAKRQQSCDVSFRRISSSEILHTKQMALVTEEARDFGSQMAKLLMENGLKLQLQHDLLDCGSQTDSIATKTIGTHIAHLPSVNSQSLYTFTKADKITNVLLDVQNKNVQIGITENDLKTIGTSDDDIYLINCEHCVECSTRDSQMQITIPSDTVDNDNSFVLQTQTVEVESKPITVTEAVQMLIPDLRNAASEYFLKVSVDQSVQSLNKMQVSSTQFNVVSFIKGTDTSCNEPVEASSQTIVRIVQTSLESAPNLVDTAIQNLVKGCNKSIEMKISLCDVETSCYNKLDNRSTSFHCTFHDYSTQATDLLCDVGIGDSLSINNSMTQSSSQLIDMSLNSSYWPKEISVQTPRLLVDKATSNKALMGDRIEVGFEETQDDSVSHDEPQYLKVVNESNQFMSLLDSQSSQTILNESFGKKIQVDIIFNIDKKKLGKGAVNPLKPTNQGAYGKDDLSSTIFREVFCQTDGVTFTGRKIQVNLDEPLQGFINRNIRPAVSDNYAQFEPVINLGKKIQVNIGHESSNSLSGEEMDLMVNCVKGVEIACQTATFSTLGKKVQVNM